MVTDRRCQFSLITTPSPSFNPGTQRQASMKRGVMVESWTVGSRNNNAMGIRWGFYFLCNYFLLCISPCHIIATLSPPSISPYSVWCRQRGKGNGGIVDGGHQEIQYHGNKVKILFSYAYFLWCILPCHLFTILPPSFNPSTQCWQGEESNGGIADGG